MNSFTRKLAVTTAIFAVAALSAGSLGYGIHRASAQDAPRTPKMENHAAAGHGHKLGMAMQHGEGMHGMHDMQGMHGSHGGGQMHGVGAAGQDAFGAIQEVVRMLEADPKTDWSKVDLEALRQHLIDMNEVTLNADAAARPVDGGIEVAVTGRARTLAAIQRMLPAHAKEIDGHNGWRAKAEPIADGVRLTVTSGDAKEVARLRGLGFIGLMVTGAHHQPHHLAIAKGETPHAH